MLGSNDDKPCTVLYLIGHFSNNFSVTLISILWHSNLNFWISPPFALVSVRNFFVWKLISIFFKLHKIALSLKFKKKSADTVLGIYFNLNKPFQQIT